MSTSTKHDVIDAAMSLADDVAHGRVNPSQIEGQAVAELSDLVGTVAGPDDPIWELQVQIARGVLAAGGIPADELSEWTAVARRRDGITEIPAQAIPTALRPHSPEFDALADDVDLVDAEESIADEDHDPSSATVSDSPAAVDECVPCQSTPSMVATADGRQIPPRLIAARGRGVPDVGLLG